MYVPVGVGPSIRVSKPRFRIAIDKAEDDELDDIVDDDVVDVVDVVVDTKENEWTTKDDDNNIDENIMIVVKYETMLLVAMMIV